MSSFQASRRGPPRRPRRFASRHGGGGDADQRGDRNVDGFRGLAGWKGSPVMATPARGDTPLYQTWHPSTPGTGCRCHPSAAWGEISTHSAWGRTLLGSVDEEVVGLGGLTRGENSAAGGGGGGGSGGGMWTAVANSLAYLSSMFGANASGGESGRWIYPAGIHFHPGHVEIVRKSLHTGHPMVCVLDGRSVRAALAVRLVLARAGGVRLARMVADAAAVGDERQARWGREFFKLGGRVGEAEEPEKESVAAEHKLLVTAVPSGASSAALGRVIDSVLAERCADVIVVPAATNDDHDAVFVDFGEPFSLRSFLLTAAEKWLLSSAPLGADDEAILDLSARHIVAEARLQRRILPADLVSFVLLYRAGGAKPPRPERTAAAAAATATAAAAAPAEAEAEAEAATSVAVSSVAAAFVDTRRELSDRKRDCSFLGRLSGALVGSNCTDDDLVCAALNNLAAAGFVCVEGGSRVTVLSVGGLRARAATVSAAFGADAVMACALQSAAAAAADPRRLVGTHVRVRVGRRQLLDRAALLAAALAEHLPLLAPVCADVKSVLEDSIDALTAEDILTTIAAEEAAGTHAQDRWARSVARALEREGLLGDEREACGGGGGDGDDDGSAGDGKEYSLNLSDEALTRIESLRSSLQPTLRACFLATASVARILGAKTYCVAPTSEDERPKACRDDDAARGAQSATRISEPDFRDAVAADVFGRGLEGADVDDVDACLDKLIRCGVIERGEDGHVARCRQHFTHKIETFANVFQAFISV